VEKFWLLYVERDGCLRVTVKHSTLEKAQKSAEELARLYDESKVYLLETVGVCSTSDKPVKWEK